MRHGQGIVWLEAPTYGGVYMELDNPDDRQFTGYLMTVVLLSKGFGECASIRKNLASLILSCESVTREALSGNPLT